MTNYENINFYKLCTIEIFNSSDKYVQYIEQKKTAHYKTKSDKAAEQDRCLDLPLYSSLQRPAAPNQLTDIQQEFSIAIGTDAKAFHR